MKVAICDDEEKIAGLIKQYVESYFGERKVELECVSFTSGLTLLSNFDNYDIVFLDIEMPDCNGIEIASEINDKSKDTLIFIVTAYHNYLDDAMDQNVFRYIDKPVERERLYKGLDKAMEHINNTEFLFISSDGSTIRLSKNDVLFIESQRRNAVVHTLNRSYDAREKLDYFKYSFSTSSFVVPHNSYIVNLNHVIEYNRTTLVMRDGSEIPVSQKKQPEVKRKFLDMMRKD